MLHAIRGFLVQFPCLTVTAVGAEAPPTGGLWRCPLSRSVTITGKNTTNMADNETLECITEHERILQEIESTDTACVGPTLRYGNMYFNEMYYNIILLMLNNGTWRDLCLLVS